MKTEMKRIQSNLLLQNCFVRDYIPPFDKKTKYSDKKFYSEIPHDDGTSEIREFDYPITPKYVASFADGADYHNQLDAVWNAPARGSNLGDVSLAQEVLTMDRATAQALLSKIGEGIDKVEAAKAAPAKAAPVVEGEEKDEVKENE